MAETIFNYHCLDEVRRFQDTMKDNKRSIELFEKIWDQGIELSDHHFKSTKDD